MTLYFVIVVKCGILGVSYRLPEVMVFFVIPKLQHFIYFATLGTLELQFVAMNNQGPLNNCVYFLGQVSFTKAF